jgi:RHS repeat-associated protein
MDGIQMRRQGTARSWFFGFGIFHLLLLTILLSLTPISFGDSDGDDCISDPGEAGEGEGACYAPPDPGKSNGPNDDCPHCGDPIDASTGNVYEIETDYAGTGPFPLNLTRYYNSQSTLSAGLAAGALGANWSHHLGSNLVTVSATSMEMVRADGKAITFTLASGNWTADADINAKLVPVLSGITLTGWNYTTEEDHVESYDASGKLVSIANRAGLKQTFAYDASGRLVSVTDPFARTLSFSYDANNRIIGFTDPSARAYAYAYDANNNLIAVTYPDGKARKYLYEIAAFPHLMTGLADENGVRLSTWTYDSKGVAIASELAGGVSKTSMAYDFTNGITTITDALSHSSSFTFGTTLGIARPVQSTQPGPFNASAAWAYDANGNVIQYTDYKGNVTTYSYDLTRNLETSRTEAYGTPQARTITTAWHGSFRLPINITEPNRVTTLAYDTQGNLTSLTVTAGSLTRTWGYTYNANGQVTRIDGPRTDVSDQTTFSYDTQGNLTSITDALGHITQITAHDADGRPLTIKDANGLITVLTYDQRGRLLSRKVGTETTAYTYDAVGQLKKVTKPDASYTAFTYDPAHRLVQVNDNLGNKIIYTLDAMGNRIKEQVRDPANVLARSLTRTFDELNRTATSVGASGQTTKLAYDADSNVTTVSDPLAHNSKRVYDALNRPVANTDPLLHQTQYAYDANDNLVKVTDPRSLITQYTYDGLGNRTNTTSPDSGITVDSFDDAGNRITSTDARSKATAYAYDALNRPTSLSFASGTPVQFSYDGGTNGLGHLTSMTDETGSTAWAYDSHGRVLQKTQTIGTTVQKLLYAYDAYGRINQITYPSGKAVGISYNAAGQPVKLTQGAQTILSGVGYTAFGAIKAWTWGNAQGFQRSFDTDGRLTGYPLGGGRTNSLAYDKASRIVAYNDSDAAQIKSFQYDAAGRLTSMVQGQTQTAYFYDANGNRTELAVWPPRSSGLPSSITNYSYDKTSNKLKWAFGAVPKPFTYNAKGDTLADGTLTYGYNDRGRLAQANYAGTSTQFGVNGLGQRVTKTAGAAAVVTLFAYDEAGHLLGEYAADGTALRETVWLGDTPVAVIAGGAVYSIYADHLNSPRAIADATGKVLWRWDSEPFGSTLPNQDVDGDGIAFTYNLRFPGQYYDVETGLHYNYFRDYNPAIGRYLQSDPIGLEGGTNTYNYVHGSPLGLIDRRGLCIEDLCIGEAIIIGEILTEVGEIAYDAYQAYMAAQALNNVLNQINDVPSNQPPWTGDPGSTSRGGTGSRTYGPDGYPETDRDWPHPDHSPPGNGDHCHDWGRPSNGGPPTNADRGPPRTPEHGDPPPPRGPNVPPP